MSVAPLRSVGLALTARGGWRRWPSSPRGATGGAPSSAGDPARGRGAGPAGPDARLPRHRPGGAAAHPHPTPAPGRLSVPDRPAGGTSLARRAPHRAAGARRPDPAPLGLSYGGPAASLGSGAASALAFGGPGRWGGQRKRNPGGPARAGPYAPRRDPRHRGGLAYKDPHGPAHRGPGRGVSAHHQRQPTASPSAAGAPSARGWCPLGGRGPRRATAGSTRRCGPPPRRTVTAVPPGGRSIS